MKVQWATILIALLLCGCYEEPLLEQSFLIKKGKHYASERKSESLQSKVLTFEAKFDASARYQLPDDPLQSNLNKLLGFSDCNSHHHENSARFAWRWYRDRLEIHAYVYHAGTRLEEYIGEVDPEKFHRYQIELTDNSYRFSLDDKPALELPRATPCKRGLYYMLWPYFGGSLPAPHDINIVIRRIYD